MSFFTPTACSTTRSLFRVGAPLCRLQSILPHQHAVFILHARFKSGSVRPPSRKPAEPARKPLAPGNSTLQKKRSPTVKSAEKTSLILNSLRKPGQLPGAKPYVNSLESRQSRDAIRVSSSAAKGTYPRSVPDARSSLKDSILRAEALTVRRRRKVLWPGIWTLFAIVGTYGTLAYLDVKAGVPSSDGSHLPERAQLPQTWYLTPTVIREGVMAGWKELDNLTIGIVVATVAMHLLRKSPLPIWEKMIHVTGAAKWSAFTYPFLQPNWTHLVADMTLLVWFLPSVVYYFDGDLFHTSAFLVSVPLITSYLTHFAYRFNLTKALVWNLGAGGAVFAAFGIYCMAYATEKVWMPFGLVIRVDARDWGLMFVLLQAYNMTRISKGANTTPHLVLLASFALGLAYAHFDLKHHLWIPLVSEISSSQKSSIEIEE